MFSPKLRGRFNADCVLDCFTIPGEGEGGQHSVNISQAVVSGVQQAAAAGMGWLVTRRVMGSIYLA